VFGLARLLVSLNHIASFIVNANDGIMRPTEKVCVTDRVADGVGLAVAKPTESQHIEDQIDAALVFAGCNFANVHLRF
jgi:hypothetical protein